LFVHWKSIDDVPEIRLKQIQHFFEHYKDLEAGKWVKILGWSGIDVAHKEILDGIKRNEADKLTRN
jgi:inorganic pyrophosphatase